MENLDKKRKRVLFRSHHCGMKENDLILGAFAERHVDALSHRDLDDFERLMERNDIDVLNWICGREDPPKAHDTPLMMMIKNFNKTL